MRESLLMRVLRGIYLLDGSHISPSRIYAALKSGRDIRERGKRGGELVLRKTVGSCLALGAVVALGACGSSSSSTSSTSSSGSTSGGTVDIYSSLPLLGPSTTQTKPMVNGIKLALDQAGNKAGNFD